MAIRIVANHCMAAQRAFMPVKACTAFMSSSTAGDKPKPKRESLLSWLSVFFPKGKMDPADPKDGPIYVKDVRSPDAVEIATGEEALLLLAFEQGIIDPYCNLPVERQGRGTKDNPIPVESARDERIVGCICEPSQNHIKYMTVYKGEPKRCKCGWWYELRERPAFWKKIPKEELVQIPYFMELDMEGKLDALLADAPADKKKQVSGGH